jgi:hypothetical protein
VRGIRLETFTFAYYNAWVHHLKWNWLHWAARCVHWCGEPT